MDIDLHFVGGPNDGRSGSVDSHHLPKDSHLAWQEPAGNCDVLAENEPSKPCVFHTYIAQPVALFAGELRMTYRGYMTRAEADEAAKVDAVPGRTE